MFSNGKNDAFITLKDHKPNFENNPKTRLINPAKNEIGRISKVILEQINYKLRQALKVNQWRSTSDVLDWFSKITDKKSHTFLQFDVKDFYPSISKKLLTDALNFANRNTTINRKDRDIIFHARKSLLFNQGEAWMKKGGILFDVTMGAFDGAEVCELVGVFMLSKITSTFKNGNLGLYRDDGLGVFKNFSGQKSERAKKILQSIFKEHGLEIVIECNKKVVDFLDVTLNLNDGTYKPYTKPDNTLQYINVQSNHPPNIIEQLPKTIEKRLSQHSSNELIFRDAAPKYEKALQEAGYNVKLQYTPEMTKIESGRKNRKRNIIWFNPPFSKNVETKVGQYFLKLVDKHFPKHHKFHKIFNRNTLKVSYSCTPNMKSIIQGHNKKILKGDKVAIDNRRCNCIEEGSCPMNGECLASNIVYEARLTSDEPNSSEKVYIGIAETTFKKRFSNHKKTFNHAKYKNETELSKEVWKIKDMNYTPKIAWRIAKRCQPINRSSLKCSLCLTEKMSILLYDGDNLINKRSELISKCRHLRKYTLKVDSKD